jgi:N-acetylmuramoyl-L-alanine amidase
MRHLQSITGRGLTNTPQVTDIQRKMVLHSLWVCASMRVMRRYLNSFGGFFAVVILATAPLCNVQASDLKGARVWAGPQYTRLVIDASGPLDYKVTQSVDQLVVDLGDSQVTGSFADPSGHGLFHGMTHGRQGGRLQLTAKVAPNSRLKSFVLKPASGSDYRLVLDLYPGSAPAATPIPHSTVVAEHVASDDVKEDISDEGGSSTARGAREVAAVTADVAVPTREPVVMPASSRTTRESRKWGTSSREAAAMLGGQRKVVVAIDAGHGGKDQGAHGPSGLLEKNVTLAVAQDLAAQINRQPGMKAVLTRDGDYFIELTQRYKIAREAKADLFVSIHADSFTSDDAKGSSVWVLSPRGKTSEAARFLADRENADLIGGTTLDDKDDSLAKVLLDLQQSWAVQASDAVAGNVLKALGLLGPTHRGYVERANFVVLRSPDVPSILVETAFISNPAEERKLRDPKHQDKLATAVMGGVKGYFESTPPPGTWFAAQASLRDAGDLASTRATSPGPVPAATDSDDGDTAAATTGGKSRAYVNARDLHRVGPGESLSSIARQYGISVGALKSANQINTNSVHAGTMLAIPTS